MKRVRSPDRGSSLLGEGKQHMNERAIMALLAMLDQYENIPLSDLSQHEAEEIAFSRCAVEEILTQIWDHPWTLASETIEKFALTMQLYKSEAVTDEQRRVFSVSTETALEILEEIEALER